jgi:hypothetical protein
MPLPALAACPSFPIAPGPIQQHWNALGGCSGNLGDSRSEARRSPYTGGLSQDFFNGQIVVFDRWASGHPGQMAQFAMLAYVAASGTGLKTVHVQWGDTTPSFSYDYFNVRWDFDGLDSEISDQHSHGAQQRRAGGGTHGSTDFSVPTDQNGVLRIVVKGCDKHFWGDTCNQGFSYPVTLDIPEQLALNIPASQASSLTPPQPSPPTPLTDDLSDAPTLDQQSADSVAARNCDAGAVLDTTGDHKGELYPPATIGVLLKVRNINIPCAGLPDPSYANDANKLRDFINQKIRDAKVISEPGTDASLAQGLVGAFVGIAIAVLLSYLLFNVLGLWAANPLIKLIAGLIGIAVGGVLGFLQCDTAGNYDMRLVGIIQLRITFDDLLDQSTKDHILRDLLTIKGRASKRREYLRICGIPSFIPESENHILMTESSRYITNNLVAAETVSNGTPASAEYDNDQNGMNDWALGVLQGFMQHDFYEYNSRPYTYQARQAIQNLHDYSPLQSGTCWRTNPPSLTMPPVPRACDVRRGARIVLDYLAAQFAVSSNELRRVAPFRRQPERRDYPFLFGRASDEALPTYLAFVNGSTLFWNQRYGLPHGGDAENLQHAYVGEFRPSPVITDLIGDVLPAQEYFERFYFNRDKHYGIEAYYRHPDFLISAGGIHDDGRLSVFGNNEDAWAMSTMLVPTRAGMDRREFVRIAGDSDEDKRVNTCVAPGFACGENPDVPPGIPSTCLLTSGKWTFIDFAATTPGCDIDYGFFVVVFRAPCTGRTCTERFGFFEATPWPASLAKLAEKVLNDNGNRIYREDSHNLYVGASGKQYVFVPVPNTTISAPGGVSLQLPPWGIWGMESMTDNTGVHQFEQTVSNWPFADGDIVHSDKHAGCVIVDNPRMQQRLVLDFTDQNHPKRTRTWMPLPTGAQACGCPLDDRCLPSRFQ